MFDLKKYVSEKYILHLLYFSILFVFKLYC